jgi:phage antirepressor YoqD-like protein
MKNNNLLEFEYNGSIIPFALTGNDVMISATEMAKLFNKRIADWKRLPSTQEYLNALLKVGFSHLDQLIISEWGGSNQGTGRGTWMHRLVAIEFARWLSPMFSIWCNMKIDEIINNGFALRDAEIGRLNSEITNLQITIQSQQPQVDYCSQVLTTSENLYSTRDIVKDLGLGISNVELLRLLEKNNLIFRSPDKKKWYLREPFDKFGYTKVVTILDKSGKPRNIKRWTEEGRHWIYSLSKKL